MVAAPVTPPAPLDLRPLLPRYLAIHGFASQGAFVSTANDYLGKSSRGSFELFEAGLNVSAELSNQLRVGMQLFARDVGTLGNYAVNLDWAFIDYRWRRWLGVRAGHIKLPHGLYNEYTDIDAARVPILMPQGIYPIDSRDVLLAHTGFAAYGERALGDAQSVSYQLFAGTFSLEAQTSQQVSAVEVDAKYVVGGQLFWHPLEGLRVGGSVLRTSIDYFVQLSQEQIDMYVAGGAVPEGFDGRVGVFLRPATIAVGSAEYSRNDWTFAAEYSRWLIRFRAEPAIIPTTESDSERFYGLVARRFTERVEAAAYYSVYHAETGDRTGQDEMRFAKSHHAFQRDASLTLRYDVNEHWLWKLEAHFIDGTADLDRADNLASSRYWGLFLARTTVTF